MALNLPSFPCFIKVSLEGREQECGRPRANVRDLCCPEHWARVPRALKRRLVDANRLRSMKERERQTINAATAVVEFLKAQRIQLPPAPQLITSPNLLDTKAPPPLVKVEAGPRVITDSKLIISGR